MEMILIMRPEEKWKRKNNNDSNTHIKKKKITVDTSCRTKSKKKVNEIKNRSFAQTSILCKKLPSFNKKLPWCLSVELQMVPYLDHQENCMGRKD